jgi:dipeptidase E
LFIDVWKLLPDFAGEPLTGKKVAFFPTAALHEKINFYVDAGRKALEKLGMTVINIYAMAMSSSEIAETVSESDYIYVSGGNTFFLLQELKRSGADKMIIEHIQAGKIYIAESAGAVIMAPNIEYVKAMDDVKEAPELDTFDALAIMDFYPLPHYKSVPFTRTVAKILQTYEEIPLVPFRNSEAILMNGDTYDIVKK